MNSNTAPARNPEVRLATVWRPEAKVSTLEADDAGRAKTASNDNANLAENALAKDPAPPSLLLVQLDAEAGRFVQTWKDASTEEIVWRYPSEAQLAFSRAVSAYQRAVSEA